MKSMIIVNFGGPRSLNEVESFLIALLTDRDVIRTKLPAKMHHWLFSRIAKKRARIVKEDYAQIGGKSPIFEDTEAIAQILREQYHSNILTFHRYLPDTHSTFLEKASQLNSKTIVFPMFPQYSTATTGSIARFFANNLDTKNLLWIKSYADHPAFVILLQNNIKNFLKTQGLKEEETILLFSAHGLPRQFVDSGDIYEKECHRSFEAITAVFPNTLCYLCYQSKFGRGEWLRPYTIDLCQNILRYSQNRRHAVMIPLSFTSDHIETLFEIEKQYLPPLRNAGLSAYRLPAFNRSADWIAAITVIINSSSFFPTSALY